jgi:hypothetical protein
MGPTCNRWCGQMTNCHVKLWWGPLVSWLVLGWGPPADMDQWESVTWHSYVEVAQSGAATWHSCWRWLLGCRLSQVSKLYSKSILSLNYTQRSLWSNLSPWSAYLICFIFSEFILIAPLVHKFWNFHQKSLNSWWSLLSFFILIFPLLFFSKNFFIKRILFSSLK